MKIGTPNFNGERLREAREARGFKAADLADMLGLTRQAISQYEKGVQTPRPEIMASISQFLNLPLSYFLRESSHIVHGTVFFRSLASTTKSARIEARQKFTWLKEEIVSLLREFFVFPEANIPTFEFSNTPFDISNEKIEEIATKCRRYWGLGDGVISDTVLLVEKNGVIVSRSELQATTMDAFSEWSPIDNTPYIFLISNKNSAARSRYDIAHELGHLVMHRTIKESDIIDKDEFNLIESQADRFAAAFLLPAETFMKDIHLPTLDIFRLLKEKWRTSIAMMIMRCENLGLIDNDYARRLWINYSRRGWKKNEPLDEKLIIEQPRFLKRCLDTLIKEKVKSIEELLDIISLSDSDIEKLVNLPSGYFREQQIRFEPIPKFKNLESFPNLSQPSKARIIPLKTKSAI